MEYNRVGNSGLFVSELGLGTGGFGAGPDWPYGTATAKQATELVSRCMAAGVTLFDSADVYGAGEPQAILGQALRGRRDSVTISAKVGLPTGPGPDDLGASRRHLLDACEAALRRLETDRIDLLQLHAFDAGTPLEETLQTLDSLVKTGKVRYLGVSNFAAWQIMKALSIADSRNLTTIVGQQVYYSLVGRDYELELMALGIDQGVGALVWSPLAGGWLSGDIRRDQSPVKGGRVDRLGASGPPVDPGKLYDVIDIVDELCDETGKTAPQIAINWVLRQPTVASVIFGADDLAQLEQNIGAAGWKLAVDQVDRLNQASQTTPTYPHYMYHRDPGFSDLAPPPVRRRL